MSVIWTPNGHVDLDAHKVHRAVNEYDERLYFDFVPEFQEWAIFIKMPHGTPSVVVMKFGPTVPEVEDVMRRLIAADGLRHGDTILEKVMAEAEKEYNSLTPEQEEGSGLVAEAMESWSRNQGRTRYAISFSKEAESKRTGGKD